MPKYQVGDRFYIRYPTDKEGYEYINETINGIVEIVEGSPNSLLFDYNIKRITHKSNDSGYLYHCCVESDLIPLEGLGAAIYGN